MSDTTAIRELLERYRDEVKKESRRLLEIYGPCALWHHELLSRTVQIRDEIARLRALLPPEAE